MTQIPKLLATTQQILDGIQDNENPDSSYEEGADFEQEFDQGYFFTEISQVNDFKWTFPQAEYATFDVIWGQLEKNFAQKTVKHDFEKDLQEIISEFDRYNQLPKLIMSDFTEVIPETLETVPVVILETLETVPVIPETLETVPEVIPKILSRTTIKEITKIIEESSDMSESVAIKEISKIIEKSKPIPINGSVKRCTIL